jgi:hypothetical protein
MIAEFEARRAASAFCRVIVVLAAMGLAVAPARATTDAELSWGEKQAMFGPVQKWIGELAEEKNEFDKPVKKGAYSRYPKKVDDNTYTITVHVNTSKDTEQHTERWLVTLKRDAGGKSWTIAEKEVKESYVGLYRTNGGACYPFERLSFDREGLKITATNGTMCEEFFRGQVSGIAFNADDLRHEYTVPDHATRLHVGHDFYALHELLAKDHSDQLAFKPAWGAIECDVETCEELIGEMFTGLTRKAPEDRHKARWQEIDIAQQPTWIRKTFDDTLKEWKKDAFAGFRALDPPGNRRYNVVLFSAIGDSYDAVWLDYNNWGGFEVQFGCAPKRWDVPEQLYGNLYGYYTEETLANSSPEELERRDTLGERWLEVQTLEGVINLALDDPEVLNGDVEFLLRVKQDLRELPFFIFSNPQDSLTKENRSTMSVNAIEVDGQELTWVQAGPYFGYVILPEPLPADSLVKIRMNFDTKALYKLNHAFTAVNRGGWLPFVSFGDRIDDMKLTIRSPSKYQVLGIGHKAAERQEGDVTVFEWTASGVNFPTIIFGKYKSDHATFEAKKQDQTPIHVEVHVDDASIVSLEIAPKSLREIAEQAVNSINLYTAMSGVDYPFGELNLVADPGGFLYGQAPSSIIYLGAGVFWGEGKLSPYFNDGAAISRFKKSVTAHEVGHQWWGNTISNANERSYWFVESLAEYFSAVYLEVNFGWGEYQAQVDEWRRNILQTKLKGSVQNASVLFGGESGPGGSPYQAAVYSKGPYAFHVLRETFKGEGPRGDQGADKKFFEALRAFTTDLAAKGEIVTLDMETALEKAFGGVDEDGNAYNVDLDWFFDQWIRGSGIPRYTLKYDVRQSEDGNWIVEGVIDQQVLLGTSDQVLEGQTFRGIVNITVEAKGGPFKKKLIVQEAQTPFAFKVPAKPTQIVLNKDGEMLAHDVVVR